MAGAADGGDSARLGSHELEDGDGRGGWDGAGRFEGVREDTSSAQTSRIAGIADAWRRSPATSGGMGVGAQCRAQEGHCLLI